MDVTTDLYSCAYEAVIEEPSDSFGAGMAYTYAGPVREHLV
jgi:hypothetical protein